MLKKVRH